MGQTREQRHFKDVLAKVGRLEWHIGPLAMLVVDAILHDDDKLLRYMLRQLRAAGRHPNLQTDGELTAMRMTIGYAISQRNPGETVQT
jgi:hypothetical protein